MAEKVLRDITIGDFVGAVENEGLSYAILHYYDVNKIHDGRLRKAAIKAVKAMNELKNLLAEYGHAQDS